MIALMALLFRRFLKPRMVEEARCQADRGVLGRMEGHAEMDMSVGGEGSIWQRIRSPKGFTAISNYFVMDWAAVWMDVFGGLLIAGALAAWVPNSFWQGLFLRHDGALATIWGPLIGPLVAMLSFVCSIGNVPLAAVLWNGGISFGGVLAFIFADLIILPILNIYRKYYGRRMAAFLLVTFYTTMAAAGLIVDLIFKVLGLEPTGPRHAKVTKRWGHVELHDGAEHHLPGARRSAGSALLPQGRRRPDAADDEHAHRRASRPSAAGGGPTLAPRSIPVSERGTQLRWELRTATPMLPMHFFRNRAFAAANAASLAMSFGMFGSVFLLTQFLQLVMGYSPLQAGIRTLAWTAMPLFIAPAAGALSDRIGGRPDHGLRPRSGRDRVRLDRLQREGGHVLRAAAARAGSGRDRDRILLRHGGERGHERRSTRGGGPGVRRDQRDPRDRRRARNRRSRRSVLGTRRLRDAKCIRRTGSSPR